MLLGSVKAVMVDMVVDSVKLIVVLVVGSLEVVEVPVVVIGSVKVWLFFWW